MQYQLQANFLLQNCVTRAHLFKRFPQTSGAKSTLTMRYFAILCLLWLVMFACNQETTTDAPVLFSPEIPVDVDPALQQKLKASGDIFALNQAFNKYSWQALVAIFWPRDEKGNPTPKFTDPGQSTWLGWKEVFQVYRADGGVPTPWGSDRTGEGAGLSDTSFIGEKNVRVFLSNLTPTGRNIANEEDQAFAGKLFDQNGNLIYYEVLMNREEFDYVVNNKLYNINGQLEFTKNGAIANFPKGDYATKKVGAVEIKFAWKILTDTDYMERYYHIPGYVLDGTTNKYVKRELGMIGFHISQKTPTGSQWVWSTFEHIDNLDQNVVKGKDGKETFIHPTLTDPDCEICPINVDASGGGNVSKYEKNAHGNVWAVSNSGGTTQYYASTPVLKTQAKRMVDIPQRVKQVNALMQAYFKSQNSVWQYYQLIDTQYPLDQNAKPGPNGPNDYLVPESVVNKPGGRPNLALLTNISMETFFQLGNQPASNLIENANYNSPIQIFGTESCMGCHSSAAIADQYFPANDSVAYGTQLSGDFSWLLQTKAQWNKELPKPGASK